MKSKSQNSESHFETLHDLANEILRINFEELKQNEEGVREALNPEALHAMRVATRRLRAAIKVFKDILPPKTKKVRDLLKKLASTLGKKRDFDVFSQFVQVALKPGSVSFLKLAQQSEKFQKQILSIFKSRHYASLLSTLGKLNALPSKQNILKISRKRIGKESKKVLEGASSIDSKADDKALHKLRISIKKLRYICEFFEPTLSLSDFIEKTKKVQDVLGEHQDAIRGLSMLKGYRSKFTLDEFSLIKKKYELKKKRTRSSFFKVWCQYIANLPQEG